MAEEILWFIRVASAFSVFIGILIMFGAYRVYKRTHISAILYAALAFLLLILGFTGEEMLLQATIFPALEIRALRVAFFTAAAVIFLLSTRRVERII